MPEIVVDKDTGEFITSNYRGQGLTAEAKLTTLDGEEVSKTKIVSQKELEKLQETA